MSDIDGDKLNGLVGKMLGDLAARQRANRRHRL